MSKCHEHGNLFRDFPLNAPVRSTAEEKQKDGFTQVQGCRRQPPKKVTQMGNKKIPINNSFEALNNLPEQRKLKTPIYFRSRQRKGKENKLWIQS
jgi:hypothetical protein